MSEFEPVAKTTDIPSTGKICLELNDRFIVLVRLDDDYFCVDDLCSHDGGTLGDGELQGKCLVCPRHGAQFDVRTGEAITMPATEPIASHQVRVDGETILVKLSE